MMLDDLLTYRVGVTKKSRRYGGARKRTSQRCTMLREMSYPLPCFQPTAHAAPCIMRRA